tara:strand:- start:908 stop:1099 length:192 start_codon:yes stop_codon:yes gene_type:complete
VRSGGILLISDILLNQPPMIWQLLLIPLVVLGAVALNELVKKKVQKPYKNQPAWHDKWHPNDI